MRHTRKYDINTGRLHPARKRVLDEHSALGSWHKVAALKRYKMNWRYVWNYGVNGKLPVNPKYRRRLIGGTTNSEHMANDRLIDMPPHLLIIAIQYRKEY